MEEGIWKSGVQNKAVREDEVNSRTEEHSDEPGLRGESSSTFPLSTWFPSALGGGEVGNPQRCSLTECVKDGREICQAHNTVYNCSFLQMVR